jgi:hypothetical protein
LLLALTCGRTLFDEELSHWGDNAEFIVLAKSIAAGQGLREINRPDQRVHRKYPPGWPLMLAAIEGIKQDAFEAMKHLVLALFALGTVLTYRLIARWGRPRLAVVVAILLCTNHLALHFSHVIMAEVPYLFFSMAALLLHARLERAESPRWLLGGLIAVVTWAALVKSSGLALAAGIGLTFALHRRPVQAGLLVGGGALALLLTCLIRGSAEQLDYLRQFIAVDPYDPAQGFLTLGAFLVRMGANLERYLLTLLPDSIVPVHGMTLLALPLVILVVSGCGIGLWRRHVSAVYYLCYLALLLAWPERWAVHRMVLPLLPLSLYLAGEAMITLGEWITRRHTLRVVPVVGRIAAAVLVGLVAISNLIGAVRVDWQGPQWRRYYEALAWLRQNSPPNSVVLCRQPSLGYLLARRQTVGVPFTRDRGSFNSETARLGVTHVVVDQLDLPGTREYLVPLVKGDPSRYRLVHRTSGPFASLVFEMTHRTGT